MKVMCIDDSNIPFGEIKKFKRYKVILETDNLYMIVDKYGQGTCWKKDRFRIIKDDIVKSTEYNCTLLHGDECINNNDCSKCNYSELV